MKTVIIYLLVVANLLSILHLGLYVVGANIYDIRTLLRKKKERNPQANTLGEPRVADTEEPKAAPLVSVIVPAHNESIGIRRTLDSIARSTYSNIEIITVDDGSHDDTMRIVHEYIRNRPTERTVTYNARHARTGLLRRRYAHMPTIRVANRLIFQQNAGKGAAMNNAIRNFARGEYVMCLDADSLLDRHAITNVVKYFEDPSIVGVAANVRVGGGNNWLTLLQRFEHMIGYRSKKFYTLTNSEFVVGGVASTYRMSALRAVNFYDTDTQTEDIGLSLKMTSILGNRQNRVIYAADVVAITEGVQTFAALLKQRYRWKLGILQNIYKYRKLIFSTDHKKYSLSLTIYRLPISILSEFMLMAGPLLLMYIIFLSIQRQTLGIFVGAYITLTLYTLWTIWPDEHMDVRQKLIMSAQSFMMYIVFYAMDLVQVVAIVRCLINYKKVFFKIETSSTWASPARAGLMAKV